MATRGDLLKALLGGGGGGGGDGVAVVTATQRFRLLDDAAHGLSGAIQARFAMDVDTFMANRTQPRITFRGSEYVVEREVPRVIDQVKRSIRKMSERNLGNCSIDHNVVCAILLRCAFWYGSFNPHLTPRWPTFAKKVAEEFEPIFRCGQVQDEGGNHTQPFSGKQIYQAVYDTWHEEVQSTVSAHSRSH